MDSEAKAALKRAVGMLEGILERQIEIHKEMIVVADAKKESIIKGDIALLENTVAEEKKLVGRIEEEEKKRQAVMPLVKKGLGLGDDVVKIIDVIEHLEEPEKNRLLAVRTELKELLETCQLKTRHNAELLKASIEHVETFMKSLNDAIQKDNIYNKEGKRAGGGPSIIDRSV